MHFEQHGDVKPIEGKGSHITKHRAAWDGCIFAAMPNHLMQAAMLMPLQYHQWLLPFLAPRTHVVPCEEPARAVLVII